MRIRRPAVLAAIFVVAALPAFASGVVAGGGSASQAALAAAKREATLAYWTPARIRAARPLDIVFDPATNGFRVNPSASGHGGGGSGGGGGGGKPGGGGSGNTVGASWPNGKGAVYESVGKVLFHISSGDYICSGTALTDGRTGYSLVITAGHCVYDFEVGGGSLAAFATFWEFIPQFDSNPTYTCASSAYGCWTATALVANGGFAREHGFTTTASHYDWGFAVVGPGGKGNTQLESTVPTFAYSAASTMAANTIVDAFGYPAAAPYHGSDLIYCQNPVGFDFYAGNGTYRVVCNMTGGSSGGPWFSGFDGSGNSGTIRSLNSYGYNGVTAMYGPIFNSTTTDTYNVANNPATIVNTIVN